MSAKRRGHGDDSIYWDAEKRRYVGAVSLGHDASGKRRRRKVSGRTKADVRDKLRQAREEISAGVHSSARHTVADAVQAYLEVGMVDKSPGTVAKSRNYAEQHITPHIGAAKLRELTADDVDRWLADRASVLASSTLGQVLSILRRSIRHAQRRDLVTRNVAELVTPPKGRSGRPSKSLTLDQARAVLTAAEDSRLHAYFVLSLLTGIRTEEARGLSWDRVHLDDDPPRVEMWRSARSGGDTKTERSRRTLALPTQASNALRSHRTRQSRERLAAGELWHENGLVFCTQVGTPLDAANVRREFRRVTASAEVPGRWTPRELRHSFVSLLSADGVQLENIAALVGHQGTRVTEAVYRHELRPVLTDGAEVIDSVFREAR